MPGERPPGVYVVVGTGIVVLAAVVWRLFLPPGGEPPAKPAAPSSAKVAAAARPAPGPVVAVAVPDAPPPVADTLSAAVRREGAVPALATWQVSPGKGPCDVTLRSPELAALGTLNTELLAPRLHAPLIVREGGRVLDPLGKTGPCSGTWRHPQAVQVSRAAADDGPLEVLLSDALPPTFGGKVDPYWVYPGTGLSWTFDPPAAASVVAHVVLVGAGAAAELVAGSTRVPFGRGGETWDATAELPPGVGTVAIRAVGAKSWAVVWGLELRVGDRRVPLVPPPPDAGVDALLPKLRTIAGVPSDAATPPTATDGDHRYFPLPGPDATGCTPLRVTVAGKELPMAPAGTLPPKGKAAVVGDRLYADVDGATLVYTADRSCTPGPDGETRVWLYPGDFVRSETPPAVRRRDPAALRALRVTAVPERPAPAGATVRVRVAVGDLVLHDAPLPVDDLRDGATLRFSRPVRLGDPKSLWVSLTVPDDVPPLLVSATWRDGLPAE